MILMNPKPGNPRGRPKTKQMSEAIRYILAQETTLSDKRIGLPKKITWAQRLAVKLINQADKGDLVAMAMVITRCDGAAERDITDLMNEPDMVDQPQLSIREVARRIGFILLEAKSQKEEEEAKLLEHENNLQPQT